MSETVNNGTFATIFQEPKVLTVNFKALLYNKIGGLKTTLVKILKIKQISLLSLPSAMQQLSFNKELSKNAKKEM